ncbi:NUDIX domain-containing protein [Bacillus sp. Cr_A10]|uniref:NUDIX hydrolase n=1 Tax=Bacillus sp. Cr_A10 TaxID=3033993 RepID=UPI0023DBA5EE|nr:NUDIX domain-containing protein [Bacillus sp. Cr_A10]MDF2066801.1 NUDIX domain-containing protein [Bacillus sp. Cr_A10]
MIFNKVIEVQHVQGDIKVNYREAIRAIIFHKNKILLVHSNKGDYKFPGGGVEGDESHSECLIREVAEETGYINCIIKDKLGSVIERKLDEFDNNALFQMTSHYYLCELINDKRIAQQLDKYESAQEFRPEWVSLHDAIEQNEKIINSFDIEKNGWVKREIFVLKKLKNILSL